MRERGQDDREEQAEEESGEGEREKERTERTDPWITLTGRKHHGDSPQYGQTHTDQLFEMESFSKDQGGEQTIRNECLSVSLSSTRSAGGCTVQKFVGARNVLMTRMEDLQQYLAVRPH